MTCFLPNPPTRQVLVEPLGREVSTPVILCQYVSSFGFLQSVNEDILKRSADAIVDSGLRDAGFVYINLDDGWAVGRDANGTIMADPKRFPSGLKNLADYLHSRSLKFGLYTARGSRTCLGRPGSDAHEQQDADFYASIGVDYLKEDSCGGTVNGSVWQQYGRMQEALNRTGRPIWFSITQALAQTIVDFCPK